MLIQKILLFYLDANKILLENRHRAIAAKSFFLRNYALNSIGFVLPNISVKKPNEAIDYKESEYVSSKLPDNLNLYIQVTKMK